MKISFGEYRIIRRAGETQVCHTDALGTRTYCGKPQGHSILIIY